MPTNVGDISSESENGFLGRGSLGVVWRLASHPAVLVASAVLYTTEANAGEQEFLNVMRMHRESIENSLGDDRVASLTRADYHIIGKMGEHIAMIQNDRISVEDAEQSLQKYFLDHRDFLEELGPASLSHAELEALHINYDLGWDPAFYDLGSQMQETAELGQGTAITDIFNATATSIGNDPVSQSGMNLGGRIARAIEGLARRVIESTGDVMTSASLEPVQSAARFLHENIQNNMDRGNDTAPGELENAIKNQAADPHQPDASERAPDSGMALSG